MDEQNTLNSEFLNDLTDEQPSSDSTAADVQSSDIADGNGGDNEDEYVEKPYSRLAKYDKYKFLHGFLEQSEFKTPDIKTLIMYLSYLLFNIQLQKHTKDKELAKSIKLIEGKLKELYIATFDYGLSTEAEAENAAI